MTRILCCLIIAAGLLTEWTASAGQSRTGTDASARDALVDLLVWDSDSVNANAYPTQVRAAIAKHLQRRRDYRTKLRRPAREGEARMLYDVRFGYERQLAAVSGAPGLAAEYVKQLKPCLEWEGYHDCPEDEAKFAESYRKAHLNGALSDYLPLLAAHRWLCTAEAYEYEQRPEEAARSRRSYEREIAKARRAKGALVRFAAEGLAERGRCLASQ